MIPSRRKQKTYSHLLPLGRIPTAYEMVSTKVLYSTSCAPEVQTPVVDWYAKYGAGSQLRCADWDAFHDPRATIYSKYTELQSRKETFVDGLLHSLEKTEHITPWHGELASFLSAARYPGHGLQMSAAYLGQLAPSGRIAMTCLFQCGDELRRGHRFAQCLALLRRTFPSEVESGLTLWQSHPDWQPLRRLVEEQLATYDWGEAFVALNLCLKPAWDSLCFDLVAGRAKSDLFSEILGSLAEDAAWQRQWTESLVNLLLPENQAAILRWKAKWKPLAQAAIAPLERRLANQPPLRKGAASRTSRRGS